MEDFERRLGGPVAPGDAAAADAADLAVGILSPHESCAAAVGAVERWVIPALARLGVVPAALVFGGAAGGATSARAA